MKLLPVSIAASLLCSASVLTQQAPGLTTITGHVAKAERLEATDSRAKLVVPAGFEVSTFASGLGKPRVLAVADDGTVYATRRDTGDVIMLRAHDRDVRADAPVIVARRPQMHGIALNANKVCSPTSVASASQPRRSLKPTDWSRISPASPATPGPRHRCGQSGARRQSCDRSDAALSALRDWEGALARTGVAVRHKSRLIRLRHLRSFLDRAPSAGTRQGAAVRQEGRLGVAVSLS
jgi:hypothetical protein